MWVCYSLGRLVAGKGSLPGFVYLIKGLVVVVVSIVNVVVVVVNTTRTSPWDCEDHLFLDPLSLQDR